MKIIWILIAIVLLLFLISVVSNLLGVNDWKLKNYIETEQQKEEGSSDKTEE